jgi:hypothetical protein
MLSNLERLERTLCAFPGRNAAAVNPRAGPGGSLKMDGAQSNHAEPARELYLEYLACALVRSVRRWTSQCLYGQSALRVITKS